MAKLLTLSVNLPDAVAGSPAQVVSMLGEPSCTLRGDFAGRSLEHLRYKPTATRSAATLVLENGVLVGVMAGYSFATAGVDSTELCPKP